MTATQPMPALAELALAQAERALGKDAGPWALYLYACDVIWDLWRDAGRLPVYVAEDAILKMRTELERREAERVAVPAAEGATDAELVRINARVAAAEDRRRWEAQRVFYGLWPL